MIGANKIALCRIFLAAVAGMSCNAGAGNAVSTAGAHDNEVVNSSMAAHQGTIAGNNFVGGTGIVTINQAPGNVNNQGNLIGFGLFAPLQPAPVNPETTSAGNHAVIIGAVRNDSIAQDAFSSFTGISAVNQISGNATGQKNVIGVSLGGGAIKPLTQQDLMSVSAVPVNTVTVTNSVVTDSVQGSSLTGISGVMAVSQSGGDLNRNTNAIGISFNTVTLR